MRAVMNCYEIHLFLKLHSMKYMLFPFQLLFDLFLGMMFLPIAWIPFVYQNEVDKFRSKNKS